MKETIAEGVLQGLDLLADGGWGDEELGGRELEAGVACRGFEGAQESDGRGLRAHVKQGY